MPWTAKEFSSKHNKKLRGSAASSAARQASAMVRSGVDEGIAIATANKRANKLQRRAEGGRVYPLPIEPGEQAGKPSSREIYSGLARRMPRIGPSSGPAWERHMMEHQSSTYPGPRGYKAGGRIKKGGPYVVGEKGPELFVPERKGTIVSNKRLNKLMGQGAISRKAMEKRR